MPRRRALIAAIGALVASTAVVQSARARPLAGDDSTDPQQPDQQRGRDRRPISEDNPRVWPAITRTGPLPMGAVDAFRAPERAAEMGVQWQRIMFDWSAIQRSGPDEWSFGWSGEETARRERDAGRPVIGQFISTPSWASGTSDPKSPPLGLDRAVDDPANLWATWVRSVVNRFQGLIDTWVMWNEPDVWSDENHARQWIGTLEQYYRLLQVAYLAAKAANPSATVLMAGMTYWWDAAYGREQYFDRLLRVAAADPSARRNNWYFDGAVLQLYNNPRGLFDGPRIFKEIMARYGVRKPVWVNETNVVPWDDQAAPLSRAHFRATQDEQASFLIQAIAYALASGVERVAVFKMLDDSPLIKNVEQGFGMVRADSQNSARPIFRTYQMARRELTQTARAQLVDEGPVNRVYLEQPAVTRRMTALWNTSAQSRVARVPAVGESAQVMDKFGEVHGSLAAQPDGYIYVTLAGATANTIPGYPDTYFIGGEPVLLLEPLPLSYQPFEPTYANLPLAGQP